METVKENKNVLQVVEIDPESNSISNSLGITPERCEELAEKANVIKNKVDSNGKKSSLSFTFAEISKECKHANELVWVSFVIGANVGEQMANPLSGLMQALGKAGSGNPFGG